uniref:Uncharacterized protein n=1 Tax=uncultured Desulfobacterium sp. TaxID=201089 RepID=E1Y914_9BACT|nr:unknown protein [uncultured Desulfobacterium sp.]
MRTITQQNRISCNRNIILTNALGSHKLRQAQDVKTTEININSTPGKIFLIFIFSVSFLNYT